ncbi:MAG TPA: substrate-binding domain-containing protein, partial [Thermoguttaceae bacterium]|nr:substrate-binding domain-containing protein [Thermoguttaceae bacterium]
MADRLAELDKVANQRHYFAARFVHDIWQKGEPGPVKEAALNHLVSLLEYGTAYESLPDLLKVLKDSQTPLPIRLRILDFIGKMGLMEDAPGFPIAEGQAFYCLTKSKVVGKEVQCEKTELWREIVETLKSVSKDSHVLLREKATAILAGKDPETPPEKPEVQTEPQKPSAPEPDGPTSEKEALFVLRSGWSASHLMDDMANVFHQKYFPDKPQIDVSVNDGVIVACKMHEDYGAVGDLAVVRNLSAPEAAKDVGPGVDGVPLAKFVVVVIVNAKNPLRHLTREELDKIFRCKIDTWEEMRGGAAGKIEHFFPLFAATETLIFRELVLRDTNLPFARDEGKFGADRQKFSSDQIIGAVVKEPRAIGFCFYSPNDGPLDNRVRILAIAMDNKAAPVSPTLETIADGSYPLTDTLTIYLRRCAPRPAHEFWKFATGPEGAKIIREHGLWPEYELNKVRGKARLKEFLAGKGPVVRMWGLRGGGGQSGQKGGDALAKALAQVYVQEKALLQLRYEARPTLQEAAQEFLRSGELLLADADPVLLSQADLPPPEGKEARPEGNEPKTETEPPPASGLKTEDQRQKPEAAVPKAETNETTEPPAQGSGLSPKHSEPGADRRDAKPGCQRVLLGYRAVGVIVHRDSPVTEITLQELQDIYWGRLERWPWADDRAAAAQRPEGRGQTKGTSATGASSGGK